ncbi:MAG: SHD1 domain-containing protein [Planctomycetia bacterium]|nr:SHD1 domain-containing protein [Planctomycetia bacterium]
MKRLTIFGVVLLFFLFANVGDLKSEDETRTWTDHSGRFSVEASLVSQDGKTVRLKKSNGKIVSLKKSQLSQSDQDYLNDLSENPFEQEEAIQTINESEEAPKQGGSLFRIEEINDSILLGDRSKEELISNGGQNPDWRYKPSIISSAQDQTLRPFLLYSDLRIASENLYLNEQLFFARPDRKMAAVSFEINSLKNKSSCIQLCQLDSGKSSLFIVPFPFQCCDFSPDGTKIIGIREFDAQNGFKRKMILTVLNVSGDSLTTELEFLPYKTKRLFSELGQFVRVEKKISTTFAGQTILIV